MKKILLSLVFLVIATCLLAQPQYYNYNNGTSANSFPFNTPNKMIQLLVASGEFNQPNSAPSGNITHFYVRISTYPLGPATYTGLNIRMGQSTITTLPAALYTGQMDTVYHRASVTLTAAASTWLEFVLDTPYPYDSTKSLIVQIQNCGISGSYSGYSLRHTVTSGLYRRTYSATAPCPQGYQGRSTYVPNCGINVAPPAPTGCTYTAGAWCPGGTLPNLPGPSIYGASEWLGDTLYMHAPTSGTASTRIRKYTFGGTWTLGTPLPASKAGGSLTACNGKLYFIGGGASVTAGSNTCYEYDPTTGAWTTKATMPAALSGHGAANWGDSVIFVYCGPWNANGTQRNVYYYRVGSNTWGTIANSLPVNAGRRSQGSGIWGNKIVISAGYKYAAPNFLKTTYIGTIGSNATQLTWTAAPDVPVPYTGLSRMGGASWDKYFFTVGGERGGGGYHNVTYVLDISTGTWIDSIKTMPTGYSNIWNQVAATCIDDTARVFVPGGYSGSYQPFFYVTGCGSILVNTKTISETPVKYDLSQNYPNPFNPTTKINYSIPKSGFVTLKVYNILGKEVATLVNEVKNTGNYIVEFNGSNLSSGTYFYRVESGTFIDTKKMILIK